MSSTKRRRWYVVVVLLISAGQASAQTLSTDQSCGFWGAMASKIAQLRDDGMTLKQTRAKYAAAMKSSTFTDANRQYAQTIIGLTYKDFHNLPRSEVVEAITQACAQANE